MESRPAVEQNMLYHSPPVDRLALKVQLHFLWEVYLLIGPEHATTASLAELRVSET